MRYNLYQDAFREVLIILLQVIPERFQKYRHLHPRIGTRIKPPYSLSQKKAMKLEVEEIAVLANFTCDVNNRAEGQRLIEQLQAREESPDIKGAIQALENPQDDDDDKTRRALRRKRKLQQLQKGGSSPGTPRSTKTAFGNE